LVAEAFLGRRPPKRLACHKDDDKLHNSLKNVYWGTHADNARDTVRNLQRKMAALSWVTASGLAKAGWTASEIDRFLPRPIMASSDPTADLYSYRSRLWRREDVAAATPAREAWKSSETGLSTAELIRDRGWTVIAAERFLPRRPPEYRRSRQPWRFTTEQVLAAEATPEFQVWRRSLQTLRDGRGQQRQLVNAVKELRSRHHTLTEIVAEWHRQDADTTDAQESA
jgi:hypothetical protein